MDTLAYQSLYFLNKYKRHSIWQFCDKNGVPSKGEKKKKAANKTVSFGLFYISLLFKLTEKFAIYPNP